MSTRIEWLRRLHGDRRGFIAQVELIFVLPIFLLFWVMMWDFGILQSAKLDLVVQNRTAAFMKSLDRVCWAPDNPQAAISDKTTSAVSVCSTERWQGADDYWSGLDQAGRENLTADLAGARMPQLIVARSLATFRFHPALHRSDYELSDRFVMLQPRWFAAEEDGFELGYDRTLVNRLSSGHGALLDLFPRLFPRVR